MQYVRLLQFWFDKMSLLAAVSNATDTYWPRSKSDSTFTHCFSTLRLPLGCCRIHFHACPIKEQFTKIIEMVLQEELLKLVCSVSEGKAMRFQFETRVRIEM